MGGQFFRLWDVWDGFEPATAGHLDVPKKDSVEPSRGWFMSEVFLYRGISVQGYLAHKKLTPPPRTALGP